VLLICCLLARCRRRSAADGLRYDWRNDAVAESIQPDAAARADDAANESAAGSRWPAANSGPQRGRTRRTDKIRLDVDVHALERALIKCLYLCLYVLITCNNSDGLIVERTLSLNVMV
jgi:hypothetical protein